VVLPKENHMQLTEAATLVRKSGEAEGSAVRGPFVDMFFDRAQRSGAERSLRVDASSRKCFSTERVPCQTPKCPLVRKHCPQTNTHGAGSVRGKMSFGEWGSAIPPNRINQEMAIGVPVMRQGTGSTGLSRRRVREGSTKSKIAMRWTRVEP
jgi:hypothetical protein